MSNLDPEYLLGGYATGTLTPEEKTLLLQAALKDQALFDALMDEEVLRELLADPKARKRLLAVLPREKKPIFLLRPQIMAMAAGLVLVVAVGWMLERTPSMRSVPSALEPKEVQKEATQEMEIHSQELRSKSESSKKRVEKPSKAGEASVEKTLRSVEREDLAELKKQPAAVLPAPSPVRPADMDMEAAAGGMRSRAPMAAKAKRMEAAASARPEFRLVRSPKGVEVLWSGEGHLYVLKRSSGGVRVLHPVATRRAERGLASTFEFALVDKEIVDIYLIREPVLDPAALLAEAPAGGLWQRIEP